MSQQITFLGLLSDSMEVNVLWHDRNNVYHGATVDIAIGGTDNERKMEICVNGMLVATVPCTQSSQDKAQEIRRLAGGA